MPGNQIRVGVGVTGARAAASEADRLRDKFDRLQRTSAKGLLSGIGTGAGIAAFNAVGSAIRGVTDYLGDSADAYREDIKSQAQLRTSLAANDAAYRGNARAIEDVLEKRIELGFSDDEQRSSLAALSAITKDSAQALEIQRTAMDLARLKGMDLASATELLGKVAGGNVSILRRYGIVIDKGATSTEALAKVQEMAAGQAEAWADSVGKTEVAQIKAAEASEKFGKQVDRLQGFVMPLATGAIEGFANEVDALFATLDSTVPPAEKLDAQVTALETSFLNAIPAAHDLIVKMRLLADEALDDTTTAAENTKGAIWGMKGALGGTTDAIDDLTDALEEQADAAREARSGVSGLADAIEDQLFGGGINAGNLAELKETHKELMKQRDAARDGSREYVILTGRLRENEKAQFDLQLQMKDKEGPKAVIAWLQTQKEKFGDATGVIQALIEKYKILLGLQSKLAGAPLAGGIAYTGIQWKPKPKGGKASGGPVSAGETYTVGERGPETLVMGSQNGTIIPHGAGGLVLNVNVSGVSVMTPGSAQELGRTLAPIVTREMQRAGTLPRAF